MNIVNVPITKCTLSVRKTKQHDIAEFLTAFFNMEDTVVIVDQGILPYAHVQAFESSLITQALRHGKKISVRKIKNHENQLMVFK